ncbi:MAG: hypothetical protein HY587_03220 [Candidatus Omnitrophica bacterium]|nr:hypothetical protein [Candidatus Omnitrophota bacterium]
MKNQRKISNLLIHRAQREIGILVVVVLLITTLFLAFLVHVTLEQAVNQVSSEQLGGGALETLLVFKRLLLDRMLISLGAGIFIIGFVLVKALHKATGPLGRIVSTLHALGEGEIPKEIVIRQGDYYVELAREVNRVIQVLRVRSSQKESSVRK